MAGVDDREQTSQVLSTKCPPYVDDSTSCGCARADEIKGAHDFNHVIRKTWN